MVEDKNKWEGHHIIVTTLGFLIGLIDGRKPIDLSALKMVIIDDADVLFEKIDEFRKLEKLNNTIFSKIKTKIQWILFSATYPEEITNRIDKIVKDASTI